MALRRRAPRLGCLAGLGVVILLALAVWFLCDPALNLFFFGVPARPAVAAYPAGQLQRAWVERYDLGTYRYARYATTDDRATALATVARTLGPSPGDWRRDDFRHGDAQPNLARAWSYRTYCPDTLVDLYYVSRPDGSAVVTLKTTQYACRDMIASVFLINLAPRHR